MATKLNFLLAAAALGGASLPTVAMAQPGYMTCQATESERKSVFTTPTEFQADSADEDKAFTKFISLLQAGKVPWLHADLSHVQGICHWEKEKNVAMRMTTNYMIHYLQLGYLAHSDTPMPDPFVP